MSQHYSIGITAVHVGVPYFALYRRARRNPDLPGLILVGRNRAFAADKIDDLKKVLAKEGLVREPLVTVAAG